MDMPTILQLIINGLLLGGIYMTISIGLNLIYGVMKVVNYAQGEFLMIGMYIAYWIFVSLGINPFYGIPIVLIILYLAGLALFNYVVYPILRKPYETQIMTFVGIIYILQNFALIMWTADYRTVNIPEASIPIVIWNIYIPQGRLIVLTIAILTSLLVFIFLTKTKIGLFIRASSQNPFAAEIVGVDTKKVRAISMGIGIALAGVGGCILLPIYFCYPYVGARLGIIGFIIITLGGLGSFNGAIVGSLLIGIVESAVGTLYSSEFAIATSLIIYFIILLLRPQGLLGTRSR
ncbi:branched-chain amino acid ABC transporter permease [Candidatus Bathyarchaeota archaeon]|nr:branched-chain amino acid ABC transporter permease [Candidatus Bathyarchaeota archaeon]